MVSSYRKEQGVVAHFVVNELDLLEHEILANYRADLLWDRHGAGLAAVLLPSTCLK